MKEMYRIIKNIVFSNLVGFPEINFLNNKIEIEPVYSVDTNNIKMYYNNSTKRFLTFLKDKHINIKTLKDDKKNIVKIIIPFSAEEFLCILKVQGAL